MYILCNVQTGFVLQVRSFSFTLLLHTAGPVARLTLVGKNEYLADDGYCQSMYIPNAFTTLAGKPRHSSPMCAPQGVDLRGDGFSSKE